MSTEEQIKEKLNKCYKSRQPVLLHGDDSDIRINLILGIHIDNGGITDAVQYIGIKDEPDSKVFLERIRNEIDEAEKEWFDEHREFFRNHHGSIDSIQDFYRYGDVEIDPTEINNFKENLYCKVRGAFESTKETWLSHDCGPEYGDSVYKNLVASGVWHRFQMKEYPYNEGPTIGGRYLYDFKGTLFLDNLKCNSSNNRDVEHYCKFGMEIRENKSSVNWLVVYVHNPDNFHKLFLAQFEPVCLEGVKSVSGIVPKSSTIKWSDIEMYLIDEDHFKIKANGVQRTVTYSEMGFKHKTSTKKTKLWSVLLKFATANNSPVDYYAENTEVEKDIQRLNDVLIEYFNISGNPIEYKPDKEGYEAEFKIYNKSYLQEHMDSKIQAMSEEERLDEKIDNDINDSCN